MGTGCISDKKKAGSGSCAHANERLHEICRREVKRTGGHNRRRDNLDVDRRDADVGCVGMWLWAVARFGPAGKAARRAH